MMKGRAGAAAPHEADTSEGETEVGNEEKDSLAAPKEEAAAEEGRHMVSSAV